nr:YggT family protein [Compostimonas suwonensis]
MSIVSLIASIAYYLLLIYFFIMWGRFIVDLMRTFRRGWRPGRFGLVLAEAAYTVTDPPIKFFRRIIPPVSFGPVALDFGWSVTMLCVIIGMFVTSLLSR